MHSSQYDELHDIFCRRTDELRLGSALSNPGDGFVPAVDMGAMINEDRVRYTEELVQLAADAGVDVHGGERYTHPYLEHGAYFRPTVIGDAHPESEYAQRECECSDYDIVHDAESRCSIVFAPVALIMKYETIEEAIAIANGTRYGLGASVFGPDQEQCVKVARRLECGMVSINDFGVFYVSGGFSSVRA